MRRRRRKSWSRLDNRARWPVRRGRDRQTRRHSRAVHSRTIETRATAAATAIGLRPDHRHERRLLSGSARPRESKLSASGPSWIPMCEIREKRTIGAGISLTSLANTKPTAAAVRQALRAEAAPKRVDGVTRFFKCGPGEYGEGDVFIAVTVPAQRSIARRFRDLPLTESEKLLMSRIHEERLTALFILVGQFDRGAEQTRGQIFRLYMRRLRFINNWDLVDS